MPDIVRHTPIKYSSLYPHFIQFNLKTQTPNYISPLTVQPTQPQTPQFHPQKQHPCPLKLHHHPPITLHHTSRHTHTSIDSIELLSLTLSDPTAPFSRSFPRQSSSRASLNYWICRHLRASSPRQSDTDGARSAQ